MNTRFSLYSVFVFEVANQKSSIVAKVSIHKSHNVYSLWRLVTFNNFESNFESNMKYNSKDTRVHIPTCCNGYKINDINSNSPYFERTSKKILLYSVPSSNTF